MQVDIKKFNVRVYGFLIKNQEVLIAEEIHDGEKIVKFPGGGLKFGEGTFDGLKREFREELDIDIQINDLIYVNNFFQNSYFYPTHQLICIYYTVALVNEAKLQSAEGHIQFVWKNIKDIQPGYLSFPIDQAALEELQKQIQKKL
jgi:8-oxo-dGTP diphosphatase